MTAHRWQQSDEYVTPLNRATLKVFCPLSGPNNNLKNMISMLWLFDSDGICRTPHTSTPIIIFIYSSHSSSLLVSILPQLSSWEKKIWNDRFIYNLCQFSPERHTSSIIDKRTRGRGKRWMWYINQPGKSVWASKMKKYLVKDSVMLVWGTWS